MSTLSSSSSSGTNLIWWPGHLDPLAPPSVGSAGEWWGYTPCPDRCGPAALDRSQCPPRGSHLNAKHQPYQNWILTQECMRRGIKNKKGKYHREGDLPQRAAHRISELKRFLYLRISGVSLWGLMLVGLTLTTEILRASFSLACSWRNSSLANKAAEVRRQENAWNDTKEETFMFGQEPNPAGNILCLE